VRLPILAALALLATPCALAAAPATPTSVAAGPIMKDGVEISILPHVATGGGPDAVSEVGLDIEARTTDAATRLGFRSLRAATAIDCRQSSNRFVSATAFDQPDLAGQGKPRAVSGEWVQPTSDSYMAAVIARVCASPAQPTPTRPPPVVTAVVDTPPPAAAAAAPAAVAATPAPPPPEPAASSAPPPAPPATVRMGPVRAAPAPAPAAGPPKPPGPWVAQVAASPDARDAQRVLDRLRGQITAPLTTAVEPASVAGAQVYRASVVGFASAADAKAFCSRAASVSKTCWAHLKAAAPAKR